MNGELVKPPFNRPVTFTKLFDAGKRAELLAAIDQVRNNAVVTA